MKFNFSGEWQTGDVARLCIPDEKLYGEYKKKRTAKTIAQTLVSILWVLFAFLFGTFYPEGEVNDFFAIVLFSSILVCIVGLVVAQIIWSVQRGSIFGRAEQLLPQDDLGRLKRRLIRHLHIYYKVFTPIVAVGALFVLGALALLEYFFAETLIGGILMVSTVVIPLVPLLIFTFRFTRERGVIVRAINQLSDVKIDVDEFDDLDDLNL